MPGGAATARALAQRCIRARGGATPGLQQCGRVFGSEVDRFASRMNYAAEEPGARVRELDVRQGRVWKANWLAAGAFSLSFAVSTMSVVFGKERVADRFAPQEVVLYQYNACPFCNKVKAFLDYHDIAYKVVEVNPMSKKEIKWSEYKKVPILVVDGEILNDSTAIITELTRRIEGENANILAQEPGSEEEEKWRSAPFVVPNIYRTPREALQAFDYLITSGNFSTMERATGKYFGAAAMYVIGKRLKKRHNIADERAAIYDAANEWMKALDGRQFMGGSKPNLADLAVFGVLRPIWYLDTGRDLMASTNIREWYARMEDAVGASASARLQEPLMGTIDQSMKV